ncbi:MAG TPA: transcription elongation factor GreA [Anaerolineae bacterium]|nr:transcription elongation factor GreA [Anaerolineae bacterium]HMR64166.1 transcription elongation factor GreA [Anaerolineae bacterium]
MADKPVYITLEGKKKLEEELEYLTTVRRREVAEAIRSAKEEGDLSENSAYDEAKLQQGFLEGQIQKIEAQLRNAVLIQETNRNGDRVHIGSTVTVFEDGFGEETYTIVGSAEADPLNGKISNESPIGQALLGSKLDQEVTVSTPDGTVVYKIVKIE